MTLAMPDSIHVSSLPDGYGQYAGYGDGEFEDEAELRARFPGAELVIFTVTGTTSAHGIKVIAGIDSEPGNPDARVAAEWVQRQLAASPGTRPIVYADLASPGYSMADVLDELAVLGITPSQVRKLTAHYTGQPHICGPASCGGLDVAADGTQWTDSFPGVDGAVIDMSALADDFFGAPAPGWTEFDMSRLPVLKQGDSDKPGSFWYVHRLQRLLALTGTLNSLPAAASVADDGVFGPQTAAAVRAVEEHYRQQFPFMIIDAPGHEAAGSQVWSVLLTGKPL